MSTKAACMPGSTLVTVPLYTLPTIERWRCRSRYRSVEVTFLDGDAGLDRTRVDHDAFAHGSTPWAPSRDPRPPERVSLELPHPHGEQEPDGAERDQHGRAAVAHQRQRHAHHGQEAGDHS